MANGILVALDGSSLAARALPYAEVLAQRCHTDLTLARAVRLPSHTLPARTPPSEAQTNARAFAEAEEYLAALRRDVEAQSTPATAIVEEGGAARVLLELARARDVALIVMASHGRSGPSHWVMGSVAEQVLRQTHLPILLLTPKALAAGSPAQLRQRLAVAVDGSETSQRILPIAQELAGRLPVPVTLIRAVEPASFSDVGVADTYDLPIPQELFQAVEDAATTQVSAIADQWRAEGIAADFVVEQGMPAEVIVKVACRHQAGWIAMASHGRGGLGGLVLGRTARSVLHRSPLPVLLAAMPSLDRYHLGRTA